MSKGRFSKKRNKKPNIWLIAVLSLVLIGLLAFAWYLGQTQPGQEGPNNNETLAAGNDKETTAGQSGENTEGPQTNTQPTENSGTQATAGKDNENPAPQTTEPPQKETEPPVLETQAPVEIVDQAEADYERWLASAMLIGITTEFAMEYPDLEITGIYLASETTMENKMESKGCYIFFNTAGEAKAVHSVPLSGERSEAGTTDISTQILGFASFDAVDPSAVNTASMIRIEMAELDELISQTMLPSIYPH